MTFYKVPLGQREGSPERKLEDNPSDPQKLCSVCPPDVPFKYQKLAFLLQLHAH